MPVTLAASLGFVRNVDLILLGQSPSLHAGQIPFDFRLFRLQFLNDLLDQNVKGVSDTVVLVGFGRSLHVIQPPTLGVLLRVLFGYLPLMLEVALVAQDHDLDILLAVLSQLLEPVVHIFERFSPSDIVDDYRAMRILVISAGDSSVLFLASSVPKLRLDCFVIDLHVMSGEIDAYCVSGILFEGISGEPAQEVGLADARVADQYDFEEEVGVFVVHRMDLLVVGF
jgi:hypothetical protein